MAAVDAPAVGRMGVGLGDALAGHLIAAQARVNGGVVPAAS